MILATLVYLKRGGQTLMIHRVKKDNDMHAGKWNGLGGKFEAGETPEACAIREVREESGLEMRSPRLRGLVMFPAFKGDDWYVFVFTADEFSGSLLAESAEGRLAWIEDDEIESLPLWESDHIFLPWLRDGKFFSARFDYDGDKMTGYEAAFH